MPYATFVLLTAAPAWLALPAVRREELVGRELGPILSRHRHAVSASYYDAEAYSARPSEVLVLESDLPHAHAGLIDELRSSPFIARGYFEIDQIIVGERARWLRLDG